MGALHPSAVRTRNRQRTIMVDGPHPIDIHVGARIRAQRVLRGLTQSDLARLVGISFQSVQKYEQGENRVSASRLYEFAQALGVAPQYFFDGLEASQVRRRPAQDRGSRGERVAPPPAGGHGNRG